MKLFRFALPLALLLSLMGCLPDPLDRVSQIQDLRVLGIVATPHVAEPGEDITLRPLVVEGDGTHVEPGEYEFVWQVCIQAEEVGGLRGFTFNPEQPERGCGSTIPGIGAVLVPEDGGGVRVPGAITAAAWEMLQTQLGPLIGGQIPEEFAARILDEVGVIVTVEFSLVKDQVEVIRAIKRLSLVGTRQGGENPPPPRFEIDGNWFSGGGEDPFICEPEGERTVPRATEIVISPDPEDEDWREPYSVLDIQGEIVPATESAFYSYFSTRGRILDQVRSAPDRNSGWSTPDEEVDDVPVWVVVRDGHGGTSMCRALVDVR